MAKPGDRFFEALRARPIAAGLRRSADVEAALRHGIQVLFILGEDIFALQESVAKARRQGCLILAHVDLIKGIGRDEAGIRFLARVLFILGEDIFALQESVAKARHQGCLILAHVDLIKGIGRDEAGVRFLPTRSRWTGSSPPGRT